MNKNIIGEIVLNRNVSIMLIYIVVMCFSLTYKISDTKTILFNLTNIYAANSFIAFLLIPVSIISSVITLSILENNTLIQQRFKTKVSFSMYIVKILLLITFIISMSVFVFMVFFSLIRGNSIFHYESSYRLINLFISSLLAFSAYSLLSLIINIVLNKIYCIFFGIIFSSIIFVFNINTFYSVNYITIPNLILKAIIIFIEIVAIESLYSRRMFEGVYK